MSRQLRLILAVISLSLACCTPVVKEYRDLKSKQYRKHFASGRQPVYRGDSLLAIGFPVGGMGEGYMLFGGRGNVQAMYLKGAGQDAVPIKVNFGLWVKEADEFNAVEEVEFEPVVRLLEGRIPAEQSGYASAIPYLAGMPRFRQVSFTGKFPFGTWQMVDSDVPVQAEMEAFNPFIPLDVAGSSLPACLVRWKLINPLPKGVELSLSIAVDPSMTGGTRMEEMMAGGLRGMKLTWNHPDGEFLVITSPEARVGSYDRPQLFWQDFADDGQLEKKGMLDKAALGAPATNYINVKKILSSGESATIQVIFVWPSSDGQQLPDAVSIAGHIAENLEYLGSVSRAFSDVVYQSSYPDYLIQTLAGDLVQMKHGVNGQQGMFREMHIRMFPGQDQVGPVNLTDQPHSPDLVMVSILQAFLAWKITGETARLVNGWERITELLEEIRAVMPGRDMCSGSLYLATLKACQVMAEAVGEHEQAGTYGALFEATVKLYWDECWNGEYFMQSLARGQTENQPVGSGCHADQLLGQCLAWSTGLDSLFTMEKTMRALRSVYRYNFSNNLNLHINAGKGNVINDEGGLLTCTWPHGHRPRIPVEHADEVWTGIEYTSAANMIYAGMVDEGLEMIRTSADRFQGYNRNPWTIHPDGCWIRRPAWHLHLALSGYRFDAADKTMIFHPRINRAAFTGYWSTAKGWGRAHMDAGKLELEVLFGELDVNRILLPNDYAYRAVESISHGRAVVTDVRGSIEITLTGSMPLAKGSKLSIRFRT
jgi:non-lysosomal glucosylceramidase